MTRRDDLTAAIAKQAEAIKRLAHSKPSAKRDDSLRTNAGTLVKQTTELASLPPDAPATVDPTGPVDVGAIPDYPASDKRISTSVFRDWAARWKSARFPGQNATADQWLEAATPDEERALAGAGLFGNPLDVAVSTDQAIDWSSFSELLTRDEFAYVFIHGEKVGEVRVNSLPAGIQRVSDWAKSLGLDIGV